MYVVVRILLYALWQHYMLLPVVSILVFFKEIYMYIKKPEDDDLQEHKLAPPMNFCHDECFMHAIFSAGDGRAICLATDLSYLPCL